MIEILNENMGLSLKPQYIENPIKKSVQHTLSNPVKAEKIIGFRSKYSLEDRVKKLLKFY